MDRFDAIKRATKRNFKRINFLSFPNLTSMEWSERYRAMRKGGRKLAKYLELTK
jgi:hypothetical protein